MKQGVRIILFHKIKKSDFSYNDQVNSFCRSKMLYDKLLFRNNSELVSTNTHLTLK